MDDLLKHTQKFFSGARWYSTDRPRCGARVIVHGMVHRCECSADPHEYHAYVPRRVASASDFAHYRVIDSDVEAVK